MKRYQVKYEISGKLNLELAEQLINEIKQIFNLVNQHYNSSFVEPSEKTPIVLTGSGAILLYIMSLGYTDLLNQMDVPSDVDLLKLYNNRVQRMKPIVNSPFIGDFKLRKIYDKEKEQTQEPINESNTSEPAPDAFHCSIKRGFQPIQCSSSETYVNYWENRNIRSFDVTVVPISSTPYNIINGINVLDLINLKKYYQEDLGLIGRDEIKDSNKIRLINDILERLGKQPRDDLIKKPIKQESQTSKNKRSRDLFGSQQPSNTFNSVGSVNYHLFDSETSTSSSQSSNLFRRLDFDQEPLKTPSPVKKKNRSSDLIPILDLDSDIFSDSDNMESPRTPRIESIQPESPRTPK